VKTQYIDFVLLQFTIYCVSSIPRTQRGSSWWNWCICTIFYGNCAWKNVNQSNCSL